MRASLPGHDVKQRHIFSSPPDLIRWSMLKCSDESRADQKGFAAAWIAGSSPAMTGKKK
jgi:hypothetical protein